MISAIVGIVFLLAGAFVYTYNTESHGAKIVFRFEHDHRVWGVGEDQTAAILLGLGVLLLAQGAFRWLRRHSTVPSEEGADEAARDELESTSPSADGRGVEEGEA